MTKRPDEHWKTIPGFENYRISNTGKVLSLNYKKSGQAKELKITKRKNALSVTLFKDGKAFHKPIQTLLVELFGEGEKLKPGRKSLTPTQKAVIDFSKRNVTTPINEIIKKAQKTTAEKQPDLSELEIIDRVIKRLDKVRNKIVWKEDTDLQVELDNSIVSLRTVQARIAIATEPYEVPSELAELFDKSEDFSEFIRLLNISEYVINIKVWASRQIGNKNFPNSKGELDVLAAIYTQGYKVAEVLYNIVLPRAGKNGTDLIWKKGLTNKQIEENFPEYKSFVQEVK